jgi:hypothetical protein
VTWNLPAAPGKRNLRRNGSLKSELSRAGSGTRRAGRRPPPSFTPRGGWTARNLVFGVEELRHGAVPFRILARDRQTHRDGADLTASSIVRVAIDEHPDQGGLSDSGPFKRIRSATWHPSSISRTKPPN